MNVSPPVETMKVGNPPLGAPVTVLPLTVVGARVRAHHLVGREREPARDLLQVGALFAAVDQGPEPG